MGFRFARRVALLSALLAAPTALAFAGSGAQAPKPGPKDRCPVCGMFVARYGPWIASVVWKDGTVAYFDGPKDLFRYYLNVGKYRKGARPEEIGGVFVTDYYSTQAIDARQAFFVAGSDVVGPMGYELVPMKDEASAKTFLADHKGSEILRFKDVSAARLEKDP
jgi:nitrous oxide reductase accessory protein NosL